jgi:hypothetical protein
MKTYEFENPFYHNYIFSERDKRRWKLNWIYRLWMFFKPLYVQLTVDGYVAYFKCDSQGRYYLYRLDKMKDG